MNSIIIAFTPVIEGIQDIHTDIQRSR